MHMTVWLLLLLIAVLYVYVLNYSSVVYSLIIYEIAILLEVIPGIAYITDAFKEASTRELPIVSRSFQSV